MVLEVIYVVRHGYRLNWTVDPSTGEYFSSHKTPTGIPSDPQLASYGVQQADQLAEKIAQLDPPPDVVYSSPFYRCLQTIAPSVEKLKAQKKINGAVRTENGISEFYGTARFDHPSPAPVTTLSKHFDFIDATHIPSIRPSSKGETIEKLHDRHAYALHHLISKLDAEPSQPRAALLCTHAASMICIGRALTGHMPEDYGEEDFRCGTCSLSCFVRRSRPSGKEVTQEVDAWDESKPDVVPLVDWKGGRGVAGGWDCTLNGDCSFLKGGEERSWHFTGDESFLSDDDNDEAAAPIGFWNDDTSRGEGTASRRSKGLDNNGSKL